MSLSKPHIDEVNVHNLYIMKKIIVRRSSIPERAVLYYDIQLCAYIPEAAGIFFTKKAGFYLAKSVQYYHVLVYMEINTLLARSEYKPRFAPHPLDFILQVFNVLSI